MADWTARHAAPPKLRATETTLLNGNGNGNGGLTKLGWSIAAILLTVILHLGASAGVLSYETATKVNGLEDRLSRIEKGLEEIKAEIKKR